MSEWRPNRNADKLIRYNGDFGIRSLSTDMLDISLVRALCVKMHCSMGMDEESEEAGHGLTVQ